MLNLHRPLWRIPRLATERLSSAYNLGNQFSVNIRQPPIDSVVTVGEPLMIDSKEVQHRGVDVIAVHRLVHSFIGPFVRRAIGTSAFKSSAGKPRR